MLSFWEKRSFVHHDLVVIGAGIVGLSTAIQFKNENPNASVLVLERGIFPSGASTRNAGFACFGSLTEILDDLNALPVQEVKSLVEKRYQGLRAIRTVFGDKALGYEGNGGFELITSKEEKYLGKLDYINTILSPIFGEDVFELEKKPVDFGFSSEVKAIVRNKFEGELDSGKFLNTLWETCQVFKIKILTGAAVKEIDQVKKTVTVQHASYDTLIDFEAEKIAVCTNAFTSQLIGGLDMQPGRGMVMVTKPLTKTIPWKGAFHYDLGYVYFRNIENRLLIGGGRNMDIEAEQTLEPGINPKLKKYLQELAREIILPGQSIDFDQEWSGVMSFGPNKKPIIERVTQDIGMAVRLGGMGVAIGWQTASDLVKLLRKQ